MRRDGVRDDQWARIQDLLPGRVGHVGRTAKDNRLFVEAVLYRFRTGVPWRDLPERYGPYTTAYNRFNRWRKAGVWDRLMDAVTKAHDGQVQMIDSSIVRVHQHASGVKKRVEFVVLGEVAEASPRKSARASTRRVGRCSC